MSEQILQHQPDEPQSTFDLICRTGGVGNRPTTVHAHSRGTVESDAINHVVYAYGFDGKSTPTQARALAAALLEAAVEAEA